MSGWVSRRGVAAVAGALVWLLMLTPASAQTADDQPPDQVDPPAPGEGEPLDDPSDPVSLDFTTAAQPSPTISLSGPSWPRPTVNRYYAGDRYAGAVRASRVGWRYGAGSVVIANGKSYASSVVATTLAGAVNGPLLLTPPMHLPDAVAHEINRLQPKRVFIVGPVDARVTNRVKKLAPNVTSVAENNPYSTAMSVARLAVQLGANPRTVIVVSGSRWGEGLGVSALAANRQFPVLLAKRASGGSVLARRVRELGAHRVYVAARRSVINDSVVQGLPNVKRLGASGAAGTATKTARRARALGLTGRPVMVSGSHWADAVTWGTMTGRRRDGVVLAPYGLGLARPVARWLQDIRPPRLDMVKATRQLTKIARCQVSSGRFRSWLCAEKTLRRQGYDIRKADGRADRFSIWAIYAFEKVARRSPNGSFKNAEWNRMLRNPRHAVRRPDLPSTHVEIDIGRQLLLLVENGKVRHHFHTSTGKPSTPTIRGTFTVYEMRPYYQPHNKMYYPIFFYGGYAIHGYPSIPTYPASHGCARTYNGNQDLIFRKMFIGERVATY